LPPHKKKKTPLQERKKKEGKELPFRRNLALTEREISCGGGWVFFQQTMGIIMKKGKANQ